MDTEVDYFSVLLENLSDDADVNAKPETSGSVAYE
jgi:hypothetical protein